MSEPWLIHELNFDEVYGSQCQSNQVWGLLLTREGLGGANQRLVSERLENTLDSSKLLDISHRGGSTVGVDVVDVALAVLGLVCMNKKYMSIG